MEKLDHEANEAGSTEVQIVLCPDVYPISPVHIGDEKVDAVFRLIGDADISVVNFEIPLTDRGVAVPKLLNIKAPPSAAQGLSSLGFSVATVANNHAGDYGWDGLVDTRHALEAQSIKVVGMGETLAEALRPAVARIKSKNIGVIAFSCLAPAGFGASPTRPGIACLQVVTGYELNPGYQMEEPGDPGCMTIRTRVRDQDLAAACEAVRQAKQNCDCLIASVHWGFGSTEALAEYQEPLAMALIDAGADVIHGHHPHAIQAVGFYRQKPVIFSANVLIGQQVFLPASDQVHEIWRAMSDEGFVTRLCFGAQGVFDIEIIPTLLNARRLPEIAPPDVAGRIFDRLSRLSGLQGGVVRRVGGRIMLSPS
nr:CapA family protein [Aminobacter aminovorans]